MFKGGFSWFVRLGRWWIRFRRCRFGRGALYSGRLQPPELLESLFDRDIGSIELLTTIPEDHPFDTQFSVR